MRRATPSWRSKAAACIKAETGARTLESGVAVLVKSLKAQASERGLHGAKTPPYDPSSLATLLGAKEIRAANLGFDGRVIMEGNNLVIEYDASAGSEARRRFTLAHEVGHLIIFKTTGRISAMPVGRTPSNSEIERLCNTIASEVLMPRDEIKKIWNEYYGTGLVVDFILQLSKNYFVSRHFAAIRFSEICLPRVSVALLSAKEKIIEWSVNIHFKSDLLKHITDSILSEIETNSYSNLFMGSCQMNNRVVPYECRLMTKGRWLIVAHK